MWICSGGHTAVFTDIAPMISFGPRPCMLFFPCVILEMIHTGVWNLIPRPGGRCFSPPTPPWPSSLILHAYVPSGAKQLVLSICGLSDL